MSFDDGDDAVVYDDMFITSHATLTTLTKLAAADAAVTMATDDASRPCLASLPCDLFALTTSQYRRFIYVPTVTYILLRRCAGADFQQVLEVPKFTKFYRLRTGHKSRISGSVSAPPLHSRRTTAVNHFTTAVLLLPS